LPNEHRDITVTYATSSLGSSKPVIEAQGLNTDERNP